jgi:hypothetical protein
MENPVQVSPQIPVPPAPSVVDIPEEIKGWSWGGFLWSWIWGIGNNTWIALLALIPFPGLALVIAIVLGVKGREWAWKNKHWNSVEDFKKTQRNWVKWWFIIVIPLIVLYIVGMIAMAAMIATSPTQLKNIQTQQQSQPTIQE